MKISLSAAVLMLLASAGLHPGHAADVHVSPASITAPASNAAVKAVAWPHEGSDLPHDESVMYGTLPNGLRYAIMPTKAQPGRASLRMQIAVGSLYEQADEQGVAHFLEHMAFNGMRRFPARPDDRNIPTNGPELWRPQQRAHEFRRNNLRNGSAPRRR
jgi:zinc protease